MPPATSSRPWVPLAVAAAGLLVMSPIVLVASALFAGWWWPGPETTVPQDGGVHRVVLSQPGARYVVWSSPDLSVTCGVTDARGTSVPVDTIAFEDQVLIGGGLGKTVLGSSASFRAPPGRTADVACQVGAAPRSDTVGLGPAPGGVTRTTAWAELVPGPLLFLVALTLGGWSLARLRSARLAPDPRGNEPVR